MSPEPAAEFHPREIELARTLKEQDFDWVVKTGEWFYAEGGHHVVIRTEDSDDGLVLYGRRDTPYKKDDVVPLLHRVDCREWLMERGWDLSTENMPDGNVKVTTHRRQTEFRVEKTEPTELAALYAAMIEVHNLIDFGWT